MCAGPELIMGGSALFGAVSGLDAANRNAAERARQSIEEEQAVLDHVQQIRKATKRQVGSARAATAASGVALDEFSNIITDEIEQAGAHDEAMTLLTGRRRADAIRRQSANEEREALFDAGGGLLSAGASIYGGWKGRIGTGGAGGGGY